MDGADLKVTKSLSVIYVCADQHGLMGEGGSDSVSISGKLTFRVRPIESLVTSNSVAETGGYFLLDMTCILPMGFSPR